MNAEFRAELDELTRRLGELDAAMLLAEADSAEELSKLPPPRRWSGRNLVHYLSIRRHDVRDVQGRLAELGLSSLGRSESAVRDNVRAVIRALNALRGVGQGATFEPLGVMERARDGAEILHENTEALLGSGPVGRDTRIMVTMPTEAASSPALVRELLSAGMSVMRINCAHDGPEAWASMIRHGREEARKASLPLRILMDVEGPKARTGAMSPGPEVVRWNPKRDDLGRVTRLSRVWLRVAEAPPAIAPTPADLAALEVDAVLPLVGEFVRAIKPGNLIDFRDAREFERSLRVVGEDAAAARLLGQGIWAHGDRAAYVVPGVRMTVRGSAPTNVTIGSLPPIAQSILLRAGDQLVLTADSSPGVPAQFAADGRVISPARISFTLPQVFRSVKVDDRVMLDDGKAVALVERVNESELVLRILRCKAEGMKLGPDKGVNLPDTEVSLPALSEDDMRHLPFIAEHADLVGFSFVHSRRDVEDLRQRLAALGGERVGIVLKIETEHAFKNLPELLMAAMHAPSAGVMIARGDLAVECGYERLAEVQEEILWLCEAAHVPVIWATQVLESLAKKGLPSRSEITDAAMGQRAECVMLNKGPYVVEAVRVLDNILRRMTAHQSKKRPMMRPLGVAKRFGSV